MNQRTDKNRQLATDNRQLPSRSDGSRRRAIYPGSFDPVTNGHLDLIERALSIFDEVIVAVATNRAKQPFFSTQERLQLLRDILGDRPGLFIESLDGLLVECAAQREAFVVIRGLRAVSDFEGEFQMALTNRRLEPRIETIFLAPREDCIFLSSRIVKEVASLGGNVEAFVPRPVVEALRRKYSTNNSQG
ncbi:MAG: pantetheine-phosphate adenylyltransferase [Chthoniobacterales bacterium]